MLLDVRQTQGEGVRVTYNWVLPRTPLRGTDMLVHVKAYLQMQFGSLESAGYLLWTRDLHAGRW